MIERSSLKGWLGGAVWPAAFSTTFFNVFFNFFSILFNVFQLFASIFFWRMKDHLKGLARRCGLASRVPSSLPDNRTATHTNTGGDRHGGLYFSNIPTLSCAHKNYFRIQSALASWIISNGYINMDSKEISLRSMLVAITTRISSPSHQFDFRLIL